MDYHVVFLFFLQIDFYLVPSFIVQKEWTSRIDVFWWGVRDGGCPEQQLKTSIEIRFLREFVNFTTNLSNQCDLPAERESEEDNFPTYSSPFIYIYFSVP